MMNILMNSTLAFAVTLASSAAIAQVPDEAPPMAAPMTMPNASMPMAPVSQILPVNTTEVTVQLHPVTRFGSKKQVFVGGSTAGTIYGRHVQLDGAKADAFLLNVSTSVGMFPVDNFALGIKGGVDYSRGSGAQNVSLQVGPFLAYNAPINRRLSFFPNVAGLYVYGNSMPMNGQSIYGHEIDVQLELSFVIHAAEHLSFTVSPFGRQSVYDRVGGQNNGVVQSRQGSWVTTYGINLGMLGWY